MRVGGDKDARADHFDEGKPRLEKIPVHALEEVCKVLAFGAGKYGWDNWLKGMEWSRLAGSMLRHTYKWVAGENTDPESGLSHLSHAACNAIMLLEVVRVHPQLDDRREAARGLRNDRVL